MYKFSIKILIKPFLKAAFFTIMITNIVEGAVQIPPPPVARKYATRWTQKRIGTTEYRAAQRTDMSAFVQDTGIKGELTVDKLRDWLKRSRLINRKFLQNPNCLRIVQVEKKEIRGMRTEKLFRVEYNPSCPNPTPFKLAFIIKELDDFSEETEIPNLYVLQKHPELRVLGNLRDPSLPQMTFAENFYSYQSGKRGEFSLKDEEDLSYFSLIHAARGASLYDLFEKNPEGPVTYEAFRKLGQVLANFHKRFMTGKNCLLKGGDDINQCFTISHGDLNPGNIFYDRKFIYFIDTETMLKSLQQKTPFIKDATHLYLWPIYTRNWDKELYDKIYEAFLNGYVNQLSTNPLIKDQIIKRIKEEIQNKKSNYER
ncbi:MAG: hypothetical protein A2977_02920 [Alphaproteobacteria bacterium RIFCSPLOWO2_01_FULL_45_8]|nr:MAG: hypothetical protein A2065_00195 [Alphaproteobacteria bacterium GWB1_45_5]OFW76101.1 MAG: hypothetical protein A3K20_03145 [Alphaproteobacteria bacterium GWA1_45_9]OFW96190.1 MAG: hypothetical protein A2977_02920 [Alphaproteobacteria bacterium RIFCSPLOWO2_01_FULL_45_8]HCI48779.1 hypothetical protein [Holosporales bacterium]